MALEKNLSNRIAMVGNLCYLSRHLYLIQVKHVTMNKLSSRIVAGNGNDTRVAGVRTVQFGKEGFAIKD